MHWYRQSFKTVQKNRSRPSYSSSPNISFDCQKNNQFILTKKVSPSDVRTISCQFPMIQIQDGSYQPSIPVFRKDKSFYTPGFCLMDQFTNSYQKDYKLLFQYFKSEQKQINRQNIFVPKPKGNNRTCMVCKTPYQDYNTHISEYSHKQNIRNSSYNSYIHQMAQNMKNQRQKQTQTNMLSTNKNNSGQSNRNHFFPSVSETQLTGRFTNSFQYK